MAVVSEMRLTVSRTINLGNYESVKIEAGLSISREEGDPSDIKSAAEDMREHLMEEVRTLLDEATEEHVPKKRS